MGKGKLTVSVKMRDDVILGLKKAQREAVKRTADALQSEIELAGVVPKVTGALSESARIKAALLNRGNLKIRYGGGADTPYARRLYYHPEYNFNQDYHKHAKGKWLEDWLPGGEKEDFIEKAYARFYKEESGID